VSSGPAGTRTAFATSSNPGTVRHRASGLWCEAGDSYLHADVRLLPLLFFGVRSLPQSVCPSRAGAVLGCGTRVRGRCGGLDMGLAIVRGFRWLGLTGGWAGRAGGLGGQEQGGEDGACCGDGAGEEGAGDEAAQEGVGGGVVQCLAEGGMAEGGDV